MPHQFRCCSHLRYTFPFFFVPLSRRYFFVNFLFVFVSSFVLRFFLPFMACVPSSYRFFFCSACRLYVYNVLPREDDEKAVAEVRETTAWQKWQNIICTVINQIYELYFGTWPRSGRRHRVANVIVMVTQLTSKNTGRYATAWKFRDLNGTAALSQSAQWEWWQLKMDKKRRQTTKHTIPYVKDDMKYDYCA